jgi:hypothetical protein
LRSSSVRWLRSGIGGSDGRREADILGEPGADRGSNPGPLDGRLSVKGETERGSVDGE